MTHRREEARLGLARAFRRFLRDLQIVGHPAQLAMGALHHAVLVEQQSDEGEAAGDQAAGEKREGTVQREELLLILGDLVAAELVRRCCEAREPAADHLETRKGARRRARPSKIVDQRLDFAERLLEVVERLFLLRLALAQRAQIAAPQDVEPVVHDVEPEPHLVLTDAAVGHRKGGDLEFQAIELGERLAGRPD